MVWGHTVSMASPNPVNPSQQTIQHIIYAAVLELGEHRKLEFGAFVASAEPKI